MIIGILTFHRANNYGAVLQAYGLQQYLNNIGHQAYIIDYAPNYLIEDKRIFRIRSVFTCESIKLLIREILVCPKRLKKNISFNLFRKRKLRLISYKSIYNRDSRIDVYIIGSDQVWNPMITRGLDSIFMGSVIRDSTARLVSYAASVGDIKNLDTIDKEIFFSRLSNFNEISVRESTLAKFINDGLNCKLATCVLDPVLLAGREVFDGLAKRNSIRQPYLLIFGLEHNDVAISIAEKIASKMGLAIIEISTYTESLKSNYEKVASPQRFITYLKYADYVVTTSFHGTVFSILYEKDFLYVDNDFSKAKRVKELLDSLGLDDRIVDSLDKLDFVSNTNYKKVGEIYSKYRRESAKFINKALNSNG